MSSEPAATAGDIRLVVDATGYLHDTGQGLKKN